MPNVGLQHLAGRVIELEPVVSVPVESLLPGDSSTNDAVADCIRRLLSMADRKAKVEGIPDTESAATPDLFEDA